MTNRKSHQSSESRFMNRRTLLGGAAVMGGALAGMAIEPASALGAKTGDAAKAADSPNLNPPVGEPHQGHFPVSSTREGARVAGHNRSWREPSGAK
jgi:hypothetical protein